MTASIALAFIVVVVVVDMVVIVEEEGGMLLAMKDVSYLGSLGLSSSMVIRGLASNLRCWTLM